MKKLLILFYVLAFLPSFGWSEITYEVVNLDKRLVRLTYTFDDTLAGNKLFIFPQGGFIHSGLFEDFIVESVFDMDTQEELPYEIKKVPNGSAPQLYIHYRKPIPPGGKKPLSITVQAIMPQSMFSKDSQGRYTLTYETSHVFVFIVPKGYHVVYTNQPVWIFEKSSKVYVQQRDKNLRVNTIKIKPLDEQQTQP